jgi:phospholipase/carboxylesterase
MSGSSKPSSHASGLLSARPQIIAQPSGVTPGRHRLGLGSRRDGAFLIPQRLDPSRPAPLIVALHGAGGEASHMIDPFATMAEERGIVVFAPDSRGPTWDVIRGGYGPDVAFIDEALRKIFQLHPVDPARVAVSGFSDGASYALSIGVINGELFSDILAFSPGFLAPTQAHDSPRVFISHGEHDEVLPIDPCSRRIVPALRKAGYDVDYQEFDGGHVVPPDMVARAVARFLD